MATTPRLKVHENRRFLAYDSGEPFFYLGDTAWELFHRLSREEADTYLRDRASKRFNVIQAVALAELDGLHTPNAHGEVPLIDDDPTQPREAYFAHLDWVIERAAELGMFTGLLPTWGDKWNLGWGIGPSIFNPHNAAVYGEFLGKRYADRPIIWILGGDRRIESDEQRTIIRAMADGLKQGDGGAHLMTVHTPGGTSSGEYFQDDPWLDFSMIQSGHCWESTFNPAYLRRDYERHPAKPTLDGEPCYEDHPVMHPGWQPFADVRYGAFDVRRAAYWSLFSGGFGHTYGAQPLWMMRTARTAPMHNCRLFWDEGLRLPGSAQMQHARALLERFPFFSRIPDQSLVANEENPEGPGQPYIAACRDSEGTYALLYTPTCQELFVNTEHLRGTYLKASWYGPREGITLPNCDHRMRLPVMRYTPPIAGPDWVLILEPSEEPPA